MSDSTLKNQEFRGVGTQDVLFSLLKGTFEDLKVCFLRVIWFGQGYLFKRRRQVLRSLEEIDLL